MRPAITDLPLAGHSRLRASARPLRAGPAARQPLSWAPRGRLSRTALQVQCGWVVERTIAWLGRNRRLSKDYEHSGAAMETWCYLASISLLLRRLRPNRYADVPYWRKLIA